MNDNHFKQLAKRLDLLPNGFPPVQDGAEIRLLEKLFTPHEAELAVSLRLTPETPENIANRFSCSDNSFWDTETIKRMLKEMARKGLINAEKSQKGLVFGLLPFVVGIYELQLGRMDAELARLFEDYYNQAFSETLKIQPAFHRVVPVGENIRNDMEVLPYENVSDILKNAKSWGVIDCICRVQKKLIGEPCSHPVEVCMILGSIPGSFDTNNHIKAISLQEAIDTLHLAAEAGLVHSVSNTQEGTWYICNCCTCSCGILRGMSDFGIANVIAKSPFLCHVDQDICIGCENCVEYCQFGALELVHGTIQVSQVSCVGCGICVSHCEEAAMNLVRRPENDILEIPKTEKTWQIERAEARRINLDQIL